MQPRFSAIHRHTPKLTVIEPRGLAVRSMDYYRAGPGDTAEARVNRTAHDPAGRVIDLWDPRLFLDATASANLSTIHGLSGTALCTVSVDAGLRLSLFSEAGQPVHSWDGRGSQRWMHYDNLLRLSALFERTTGGETVCTEHLSYAANDQAFADHNQCGRPIRHDDPAGVLLFNDYGLTGAVLGQVRCFTNEAPPGLATYSRVNPLGDPLSRTDAHGNEQRFTQTLDGYLRTADLRLCNTSERLPMVSAITYNAHGQVEKDVAGNGVITTLEYAAEDGRLQRLVSQLGQDDPLQDLRYAYDPVGNVLSIEDAAQPVRYFANQRIEPVSHYGYDTLYRLIEATGWEAGAVNHGPSTVTIDPAAPGNYCQTYRYDTGNNLLELTHVGPQNHGHRLVAAAHSNRCLPVRDGIEPGEEDFRNGFDANGNLLNLQPGQTLNWDVRNQLREVRPVERDGAQNDSERYVYGADGMRVRKIRSLQSNAQTVVIETRYLPGLEIRTHSGTGEVLHVIEVATGRSSVRVLHWEARRPKGIANDRQRYSLTDHLGSSTLELDQNANIITQERYYPFGGTAWSNGEAVQVNYKTVRYSGKEQDATGLYYYGFRYYVSWLQRWCNPDPAGYIDGPNLFAFVGDNPLRNKDPQGTTLIDLNELTPGQRQSIDLDGFTVSPASELNDDEPELAFDFEPSHRKVGKGVYNSLKQAHAANLIAKKLLVLGSPNQIVDLWRAPVGPLEIITAHKEVRGSQNRVQAAIDKGIGACGEHARITFSLLASTKTEHKVFRVSAKDVDHGFTIIGDPEVLPPEDIVIVDAWPTFPRAHTADVGLFKIGVKRVEASAEADPRYALDDAKLLGNCQVKFPDKPPVERMHEMRKVKHGFMQLFSIKDEHRGLDYQHDFIDGDFDRLPNSYVIDRLWHIANYMDAKQG